MSNSQSFESGQGGDHRLDQIATQWSLLRLAHGDAPSSSEQARQRLLLRYAGAIRNYVGALLQDDAEADEVAQDVMVRMLRGDFGQADPGRGRFRDLLKVSVKNMVRTHWERKRRRSGVGLDIEKLDDQFATSEKIEADWNQNWRRHALDMTWKALEAFQQQTPGCIYYTLLRLRAAHPNDDSAQLAERLSAATNRPWRADALRQQLRRTRLRFAQLLIEEVAGSLAKPSPEAVEEELIELGLMEFVKDFLPDDWRTTGQLALGERA